MSTNRLETEFFKTKNTFKMQYYPGWESLLGLNLSDFISTKDIRNSQSCHIFEVWSITTNAMLVYPKASFRRALRESDSPENLKGL